MLHSLPEYTCGSTWMWDTRVVASICTESFAICELYFHNITMRLRSSWLTGNARAYFFSLNKDRWTRQGKQGEQILFVFFYHKSQASDHRPSANEISELSHVWVSSISIDMKSEERKKTSNKVFLLLLFVCILANWNLKGKKKLFLLFAAI